jgi:hypothetical protein
MTSNLTDQVRSFSRVSKTVVLIDLGKAVKVDLQDRMLDLKMSANSMVAQLQRFANQVTKVSFEVGTKWIWDGQAFVPGMQGVQKVIW